MTVIDLDALVSDQRLPKVRLYGREVIVRPMSGAMAHRLAVLQTDDPTGTKMFSVLLELVARAIPELTPEEVHGLSMDQVTALVQLTRGQVQDVEAMLVERHEAQERGKVTSAAAGGSVAIPWTAAQYVERVLVLVAHKTGRSVREVAQESFAVTLWTSGELLRMEREAHVERMGERTDMAGLMAVAFHKPEDLQKAEFRYLAAAGTLSRMMEETRERMRQHMAAVQRATVQQTAQPMEA